MNAADGILAQFQAAGLETCFHGRHIEPQIYAGLDGAHGTSSCVVLPHEVHLTLGTLACSHASNWKKSRCRHCLSTRSCMPCSGAPHCGQASRCVAQVTVKSMRRLAVFRSTSLTDHGACNPRAAVNKVSTPPFIFCPPHQAATIALRGMGAEVKFHSKWHRAGPG